jgi:ribonuclease BN (tRNA processing enzyme)
VEFVHKANILIHDAQYTPDEKRRAKSGWGHSSWKEAALTAREAEIDRLFLIHHDPDRTDSTLEVILDEARQVFPNTEIARETRVHEVK